MVEGEYDRWTFIDVNTPEKNKRLYHSDFQQLAFDAHESKMDEMEIEDLKMIAESPYTISQRVFALIDRNRRRAYALRFDLTSSTSHSVGYYLIPPLKH